MLHALVLVLAVLTYHGSYGQFSANSSPATPSPATSSPATPSSVDTCDPVREYTGSSVFCMFPADCCTRLTCSIPALGLEGGVPVMEITINPCTSPVTMDIIVHDQNSVLFNMSGISTSQSIPIDFAVIPGATTSIDILFNATDSYVIVGLSTFGVALLEPTRIDISDPGCSMGITQPPACLVTVAPPTPSVAMPTPISTVTCDALQQLAGGGNIGTDVNQCRVSSSCTSVDCNYLGVFPFTLTIQPCNSPPGINFVVYNDTGKTSAIFNETITDTRRIPLDALGPDSAIIIAIDHPCGQDAIVAKVIFSTVFNSSILPPTTIPLDRSDCANFVPTNTPCQEAPTSFNDVCDAVLSSFQSSGDTCTTNYPDCTTTVCDLSSFSLPVMYGYTIQPCTAVPSVRVQAMNNGTVILDKVLSESRVETLNVGPTNVSVRFIVNQSPPDYRDIGVGVNLISTDPPIEIPFLPETSIPLDRCACDNITCTNSPPIPATDSPPIPATNSPTIPATDSGGPDVNQDPNRGGTNGDSNSSSGDNRHAEVIVLASIVSVLCFVLGIAISVSILICLKLKRSHQKDLEVLGSSHVSYKNLSTVMGDSEY